MKKNKLLFVVFYLLLLIPISVYADRKPGVSLTCNSNVYSGDTVVCMVSAFSYDEGVSFHAKVSVSDSQGALTDDLVVVSFEGSGASFNSDSIDTTFSEVKTGAYGVGTLKLKVSDDVDSEEVLKLNLTDIVLLNTSNTDTYSLGTASNMIKVLGKNPNAADNSETPKVDDKTDDSQSEVAEEPELPKNGNELSQQESTIVDDNSSKTTNDTSKEVNNNKKANNSVENNVIKTNVNTGTMPLVILFTVMVLSLVIAYYIYKKREQDNINF